MKRQMVGGAHRGPVAMSRQRRTLRFVQALLVVVAAGLLITAGFAWGRRSGFDAARSASFERPRRPAASKVVFLGVLGLGALSAAVVLQGPGGVRLPAPRRLEELAGRAEAAAQDRVRRAAIKPPEDVGAGETAGGKPG